MATKLRALYQRRKGRDLFDLWIVLKHDLIDCEKVIQAFKECCKIEGIVISRTLFEKNMQDKLKHTDFQNDVFNLISDKSIWVLYEAYKMVQVKLLSLLT